MPTRSLVIHTYANCSTCRKAVAWLRDHAVTFTEKPIRETPPSLTELRAMLRHLNGDLRRMFNTSGLDYRALGLKDKLPELSEAEALALLAGNGNLIKRPFLLGPKVGVVGFDAATWTKVLGTKP